MRRSRGLALALAGIAACLLTAGCALEGDRSEGRKSTFLAHTGPGGWEVRILQNPPPYGLVQYVEPAVSGVPADSRGVFVVGKAWMRIGRAVVAGLCDAQWTRETATPLPPTGRRPLQVERGGTRYDGWEALRTLPDGTAMRLRALCGASDVETAFVFLSAPDSSALYEPVWENLLTLNVGSADGR